MSQWCKRDCRRAFRNESLTLSPQGSNNRRSPLPRRRRRLQRNNWGRAAPACENRTMPPHTLPSSAPALFSHVMADNAPLYRAILDVFAASKRQFRLHLRPDDVLAEAALEADPPTLETVPPN